MMSTMVSIRLRPYAVWEAVLLVAALVVLPLAANTGEDASWLLASDIALVGFLAGAFALSLRTGTPNLAVGGIAAAGGMLTARLFDRDFGVSALLALLILAAVTGLAMALLVVRAKLPAWAVSTAALAVLLPFAGWLSDGRVDAGGSTITDPVTAKCLLAVFAVGSLGVAMWWRRSGDGAAWTLDGPGGRLRPALLGLGVTSVVAAFGGALIAGWQGAATPGQPPQVPLALAAALLGGTAVRGRWAGVAGTLLATALVVGLYRWVGAEVDPFAANLVVGLLVPVGLVVGELLSRVASHARKVQECQEAPLPSLP
jgi:ribose transport system permease protein